MMQALDSLLDETTSSEEVQVMRTAPSQFCCRYQHKHYKSSNKRYNSQSGRYCPLCKQTSWSDFQHYLSNCPHLPEPDRRLMTKARQAIATDDKPGPETCENVYYLNKQTFDESAMVSSDTATMSKIVQSTPSPYVNVFLQTTPCSRHP